MKERAGIAIAIVAMAIAIAFISLTIHSEKTLVVFLPAAGEKAWNVIVPMFEKEKGVKVEAIYGSSGFLLNQAYLSRRGDVLGSATPVYMKKALELGLVYPSSVRTIACMRPAILFRKGKNYTLNDLLKPGVKIAMCEPHNCAVGKFIKYMLEKMGIWNKIKKNIVVYTENYAKLVAVLRMGTVDVALGWDVAAKWYNDLNFTLLKGPIPYKPCITVGILKTTKNKRLAEEFVNFLLSKEAQEVFRKLGYTR